MGLEVGLGVGFEGFAGSGGCEERGRVCGGVGWEWVVWREGEGGVDMAGFGGGVGSAVRMGVRVGECVGLGWGLEVWVEWVEEAWGG